MSLNKERHGMTGTFRHPDGRVRSDFELRSPLAATRLLLRRFPEPWQVVSLASPQTIYTDLQRTRTWSPEDKILRQVGAKGRLA